MNIANKYLALAASGFLLLMALTACDGVENRTAKYLEQGNAHFEAEDFEKARISFQNVLQIEPNHIEANVRYGETLQRLNEWPKAAAQYRRTMELDPTNSRASVLLARIYLLAREPELALELAEKVLSRNAADSGALSVKAAALAIDGENDKARILAREALGIDPTNRDASVLLASLYTQTREYAEAEQVLLDALVQDAQNPNLMTLLAQVYVFQKREDQAVEQLEAIAELEPEDFTHRQRVLDFYLRQKRSDDALAYVRDFLQTQPEHVEANLALITLRRAVGEIDDVDDALLELIVSQPDIDIFRTTLAELYASRDQVEQAVRTYEDSIEYFQGHPAALTAMTRLAGLQLSNDNKQVAVELIEKVLEENPAEPQALSMRARLAIRSGQFGSAIADLRTVLKGQPEDATALALIAEAHRRNGEQGLAIDYLNQLKRNKPGEVKTYLALSNVYREVGRDDESMAALEQARAVAPDHRGVLESLAKAYAGQRDWVQVESIGTAMVASDESTLPGYYFIGIAHQGRGDHDKAISWFDRVLAEQPDAMEPMTAKVNSMLLTEQGDKARKYLLKHVDKFPKSAFAYNLLGEIALSEKEYREAEKYLQQAIEKGEGWWLPYRTLSTVRLQQDQASAAIEALAEGIKATNSPALRERLALLLESRGDHDGAITQYEALVDTGLRSDINLNNLAMLLATYRDDGKSLQRARDLVNAIQNSSNPAFLDTIGWVHYRLGEHEQAVAILKRAVQSAPQAPLIRYHLGKALYAVEDHAAARSELAMAVKADEEFTGRQEAIDLLDSLEKARSTEKNNG